MKYNGNDIFQPFNAGLYGLDENDSDRALQFEESKKSILAAFTREYRSAIEKALDLAGLRFVGLYYYSPQFYNFSTDSIDLELEIADKKKLFAWLDAHRIEIEEKLKANKSYDGYMALTAENLDAIKSEIEEGQALDIVAVQVALEGIDFADFDLYEHLEYDFPCETCKRIHSELDNETEENAAKIKSCPQYHV